MANRPIAVEQVALSCLLENAHQEFEHSLLSANARLLLWESFESPDALADSYFKAKHKNHLSDRRRTSKSLSVEEDRLRTTVSISATKAWEYMEWARKRNRQPIFYDALISYCYAFETCLKNIALVFRLAGDKKRSTDDQVFVPGDEFKRILNDIRKAWHECGGNSVFRPKVFFDKYICQANPWRDTYPFPFELKANNSQWEICEAAVNLRNAVVHQLGLPSTQEVIGKKVFPAMVAIEIKGTDLKFISDSMQKILLPLYSGIDAI